MGCGDGRELLRVVRYTQGYREWPAENSDGGFELATFTLRSARVLTIARLGDPW